MKKLLLSIAAFLSMAAALGGCANFEKGFSEGLGATTAGSPFAKPFAKPIAKIEYYGPTANGHTLTQKLNISPWITKEGILIVDFGDVKVPAAPPLDKMQYLHHFVYDPQTGIILQWTGKSTGKSPDVWGQYFYIVTDPAVEQILNFLAANLSSVSPCNNGPECGQIWDSIFAAFAQPTKSPIYKADPIPYKSENQRAQDMWRMVVELFWDPASVPTNPYNLKAGNQKPYSIIDGKKYKLGQRPDQDQFLYNFGQSSTRMAGNLIIAQAVPECFDEKNEALITKNWDAEKIALKLRSSQALSDLKELLLEDKEKKK